MRVKREWRTEELNVCVTTEEKELVRKAADWEGLSVSSWVRKLVLQEAKRVLEKKEKYLKGGGSKNEW